jgi:hypothetical protein
MKEDLKNRLISNLPLRITIYSSIDYPEEGRAKIQGVCAKCGWSLEWFYENDPDNIYLTTQLLDQSGFDGLIKLEEIKEYLS